LVVLLLCHKRSAPNALAAAAINRTPAAAAAVGAAAAAHLLWVKEDFLARP
jgi:hypothetical protein